MIDLPKVILFLCGFFLTVGKLALFNCLTFFKLTTLLRLQDTVLVDDEQGVEVTIWLESWIVFTFDTTGVLIVRPRYVDLRMLFIPSGLDWSVAPLRDAFTA